MYITNDIVFLNKSLHVLLIWTNGLTKSHMDKLTHSLSEKAQAKGGFFKPSPEVIRLFHAQLSCE